MEGGGRNRRRGSEGADEKEGTHIHTHGEEEVRGKDVLPVSGRRSSGDDDRDPAAARTVTSLTHSHSHYHHLPLPCAFTFPATSQARSQSCCAAAAAPKNQSSATREKKRKRRKSPEECIHAELLSPPGPGLRLSLYSLLRHFFHIFSCDSGGDFARAV